MPGSILRAHVHLPAYLWGSLRVHGVDEDAFTLSVAAIRRLRVDGDRAPERLDLVGGPELEMDWAIREALGWPQLSVHHHPAGSSGAFAALAASSAALEEGSQSIVVGCDVGEGMALDPPRSEAGSGAVALLIGNGNGVDVLGHTERGHPPWKVPDAKEWVAAAHRAIRPSRARSEVDLLLVANQSPPVLLAIWQRSVPGTHTVVVSRDQPEVGSAPTLSTFLALKGLSGWAMERSLVVAAVESEHTTFLGVRTGGAPEWTITTLGKGRVASDHGATGRATAENPPSEVSQGAYVSRATYLENLPSRWRLVADRCASCGRLSFPARGVCRHCGRTEGLITESLPSSGLSVEATTSIFPGAQPTEFDDQVDRVGAYDVAILRAAPDVRVTAQITDTGVGDVPVGGRVDLELRRLFRMEGEWRYGLKAVPGRPSGPP